MTPEQRFYELANARHAPDPPMYYIQNRGLCGNCLSWWKSGGNGYTMDLNRAARLTAEEARKIMRPVVDKAWRCVDIDRIVTLHVNVEDMRAADILPLDAAGVKR